LEDETLFLDSNGSLRAVSGRTGGVENPFAVSASDISDAGAAGISVLQAETAADVRVAAESDAAYGPIIFRRKAAATSRASTAVLSADPDLAFVPTDGTWLVDVFLIIEAGATGGIELRAAGNVGETVIGEQRLFDSFTGVSIAIGGSPSNAIEAAGFTAAFYTARFVFTRTSSQVCRVNWAQSVSNGTSTTLHAGSVMLARKIG
jgi:hypothetical protein